MHFINLDSENSHYDNELHKRPSFVKVYSPSCGHCQQLEPNWNKMINHLRDKCKNKYDVNVMDIHHGHLNKVPEIQKYISGYPTILALNKDGVMENEYSGNRTPEDLTNWFKSKFEKYS